MNFGAILLISFFSSFASAAPWALQRPKLVVVISVDQFRADQISKYQRQFVKDGISAMINEGAYFPYAEHGVLQAMTGPGHATILTGSYPYQNGVATNEWLDQKTGKRMNVVGDESVKTVGSTTKRGQYSPRNLIGSTVGDEVKNADWPSKVVAVAPKERGAILMAGHRADLVFWYDKEAKQWISSSYYLKDEKLPAWLAEHNKKVVNVKCEFEQPCGVEATVAAVKAAVEGEKLGQAGRMDILAIGFSSHDFSGHHYGPNSKELEQVMLAEDKAVAELRSYLQKKIPGGLKNVLMVLTGDHGVAPKPEYLAGTGIEAGHIDEKALEKQLNEKLAKKFGKPKRGEWIWVDDFNFFIDEENLVANKADRAAVEAAIKEDLVKQAGFAHVFTRTEYEARKLPPGDFETKILRTYFPGRSGHVIAIPKPFYIPEVVNKDGQREAKHLTGYAYDRMVPLVLSGFGIKPGLYPARVVAVDIAPTISFLLGVLPPALSEGRVLQEALK